MIAAVVTLGTGGLIAEAEVTLRSIRLHGGLPNDVEYMVLTDVGVSGVDFAVPVPVTIDYSDLTPDPAEQERFKRFFMFLLPYERVIYVDPSMCCVGRVPQLLGGLLGRFLLYAHQIPNNGFDDSVMVFNHDRLLGFHDLLMYLTRNRFFSDCGDTSRAVLNGYFGYTKQPTGSIPTQLLQRIVAK